MCCRQGQSEEVRRMTDEDFRYWKQWVERHVEGYEYDFFSIPKFEFAYDVNDDLTISTRLGFSKLALAIEYRFLSVELSSALDEFGFGIKAGMKF